MIKFGVTILAGDESIMETGPRVSGIRPGCYITISCSFSELYLVQALVSGL